MLCVSAQNHNLIGVSEKYIQSNVTENALVAYRDERLHWACETLFLSVEQCSVPAKPLATICGGKTGEASKFYLSPQKLSQLSRKA